MYTRTQYNLYPNNDYKKFGISKYSSYYRVFLIQSNILIIGIVNILINY